MENHFHKARNRLVLSVLTIAVILLGLGVRRYGSGLPFTFAKSAGDALWTVAVYLLLAIGLPRCPAWKLGLHALVFSFVVEFSQIYHAPWIDAIRRTLPGRLILGSVFEWMDLLRYTAGAGMTVACDRALLRLTLERSARTRCDEIDIVVRIR